MNNKLCIPYLILIITPLFFGCHGPAKKETKKDTPASSLSLHVGNEKYVAIDTKESVVTWKGSNSFGTHTGYVYLSKGELMMENGQLTGGTVEVDMNTIEDEGHGSNSGLIDHLKDPDFFDVKKFPFSTFDITGVVSHGGNMAVTGNLTIKGITHPVGFPVTWEVKDGIIQANGRLVIDRTKWDIRYQSGKFFDGLKDKVISDDIEFQMKIVAKQDKNSLARASLLTTDISKAIGDGTIYQSTSALHNAVHEFTYLVAMRDYCNKALSQCMLPEKPIESLLKN